MCPVTLNNVAGCQGEHQDQKVPELLLYQEITVYFFFVLNLKLIFFSVLPFHVVNMRICLDRKTFENNACVGQGDISVFLLSVGIGPLS